MGWGREREEKEDVKQKCQEVKAVSESLESSKRME